ncbi:MAG: hypothetical protein KIT31_43570, partial [Deltaproteobacteria bacterium]|nr:hypothetical protein [Deltaproteobacteria bacterium]
MSADRLQIVERVRQKPVTSAPSTTLRQKPSASLPIIERRRAGTAPIDPDSLDEPLVTRRAGTAPIDEPPVTRRAGTAPIDEPPVTRRAGTAPVTAPVDEPPVTGRAGTAPIDIADGSSPAVSPPQALADGSVPDVPLLEDEDDHDGGERKPSQAQLNAQKIQQALHGDKNQRAAILREPNKQLHHYVLRNPQIQLEEIIHIARMATASIEILTAIANRREWAEKPEVALALVRNPKTPVPLAIKMLDHVGAAELRGLAKQQSVRDAIQRAARKKILG